LSAVELYAQDRRFRPIGDAKFFEQKSKMHFHRYHFYSQAMRDRFVVITHTQVLQDLSLAARKPRDFAASIYGPSHI
jgi:hypothetical protein